MAVTYAVTDEPAVGFDSVPKLGFAMDACRGSPTIHGVIERYGGGGYRTLCGWIQVVTGRDCRTISEGTAPAETSISVDQLPSMDDVDVPFASFGFRPEVFDAPCGKLNGSAHLHWAADPILTAVPRRSRSEPIQRLAGFRWRYRNDEPSTHRPVSTLPLEVTGADA